MLYVLNSLIVPVSPKEEHQITIRACSWNEASALLRSSPVVSAVGHSATAAALSTILGVPIKENRIAVRMVKGDKAIHLVLSARLPEGKVLSRDELEGIGYDLALSEVTS